MLTSPAARSSAWEWIQVALLVANLAWTTLCLGGFRPDTMIVTCLLTGLLLAVHLGARGLSAQPLASWSAAEAAGMSLARCAAPTGFHPAGWLLIPFLVYAAANVLWITPARWIGWRDWFGWVQMAAVFWVVLNGVRSRAGRWTLFGALTTLGLVAVVLGCYQRFVQPDWLMLGRTQAGQFVGRASGPFGIPNSLAAFLLLLLPPVAALALRRGASAVQRVLFGYLAVVFAFGLLLTVSRGAWISLTAVLLAWPLFAVRGSWWRRIGGAIGAAVVLGGIAAAVFFNVDAARERLMLLKRDRGEISRPILWRGAWAIFKEHRLWGSGAGSYNLVFEKHRPAGFQDEPLWAHNEYLNTLSDYGATGAGLLFGGWIAIAWGAARAARRRRSMRPRAEAEAAERTGLLPIERRLVAEVASSLDDPLVRQAFAVGLGAFALQMAVDFHLKIPALAMAAATMAALLVQRAWPRCGEAFEAKRYRPAAIENGPQVTAVGATATLSEWRSGTTAATSGSEERTMDAASAWACGLAAVVALAGAIWLVLPLYRAEALRYDARRSIDRLALERRPIGQWAPVLAKARAELRRAARIDPHNGAAWADLSYATALWIWIEPQHERSLAHDAEQAADRALACSQANPEFWVRRGVALDLQGRHVEAGAQFVRALTLAPAHAHVWYYHAFHLSQDPMQHARAMAAVAFCLRLDGGNHEAQALRQRLADRSRAP